MPPSLSNVGTIVARAATPAQPLSPSGGMPPIFVVVIFAGVFTIVFISYRLWRWHASLEGFQSASAYFLATRGRNTSGDITNGRPEVYDAWIERCASKNLEWEDYMPFTVRSLNKVQAQSPTEPVRKVGKHWGESRREKAEGEDKNQGYCRMQIGVFVVMPSRLHQINRGGVGLESSRSPLRDGMAIGLTEIPWVEEDRRFHGKSRWSSSSPELFPVHI